MSNIVTGHNLPADLVAVLKKYGMPDRCISFKLEVAHDTAMVITTSWYAEIPPDAPADAQVIEHRVFKLLAVE